MLPADVYKPRTYPPPGPQWPRFGDKQLDVAFASLTEEMHSNLAQKQSHVNQLHKERLEKLGYNRPPPPAPPPTPTTENYNLDVPETQTAQETSGQGVQTERKPLVYQRGVVVSEAPASKNLVYQRHVAAEMAPVKKQLVYQRGTVASTLPATGVDAHTQQQQAALAMEMDDAGTVDYGEDDGSDIEVDDAEMTRRVGKRKSPDASQEDKKKPKIKPEIKNDDTKIKREGAKPVKKDNKILKKKDDDELQVTGVNINRSTDMSFWEEQSARELRTQLNLRHPGSIGDWAFKTRLQLLNIVKDQIKKGTW